MLGELELTCRESPGAHGADGFAWQCRSEQQLTSNLSISTNKQPETGGTRDDCANDD